MSRYIERRTGARIRFKSPLKIKELSSGKFSNARMVNYCDSGLYFESNSVLDVGANIILGIENSPFSSELDVYDVYRAIILWRKRVRSAFYDYGYGAQLISESDAKMHLKGEVDMRTYPRWNCNQSVCFYSQKRRHQGVVKNVCPNGLFIETHEALSVGQTINLTIANPKTHKLMLLTGEIVRSDSGGVGIHVNKICDAKGANDL